MAKAQSGGQDSHQMIKLFGTVIPLQGTQVKDDHQKCSDDQTAEKRPDKIVPCPRCKSMETKFCYFNNYNVNQPRHFCKSCHRYWTAGGALRNVPVGAGWRKAKPACRRVGEFLESCAYDASESEVQAQQFGLVYQGLVVEDYWHVSMAQSDFQMLFAVKRPKTSSRGRPS